MQESSRVAAGRERAARTKRAIAYAAAGGLVVSLVLARATHPGAAAAKRSSLAPPAALVAQAQVGSVLAPGSVGPAASSPSASTSVS